MIRDNFLEEPEKEETVEEQIKSRVADISKKNGFLYAQSHPDFPRIQKEKYIITINQLCDEVESVLPDVEKLIRKIFPHIKSIVEETKIAAVYLLLGRAFSNLKTALLACRHGKNLEALELSRSGKEALDLAMLFWEEKNHSLLHKWFRGKIIGNVEAREYHHQHLNEKLAEFYDNEEQPIKEMLAKDYKIMSNYTHSGYASLLDSVDVFTHDFDFEAQSGYYYCVENFHVVKDLLIKILLNLKNSFLHLKDDDAFVEADNLFKPFDTRLTKEEIKSILARHKNN